ncbi:hypothetical protein SAMN00790413_03967 [Deinococcus hopiensis KR-140]|uniref:Uncharacterized protein n=1 Tax=Deinococcus hopiensis KR-140 TaxID=695939 RepID=A0A1W1U9W0_9DEIO|nr:hypothetical protein SAMN00790413_03967 [Deinococcus hopiensis KR-140]
MKVTTLMRSDSSGKAGLVTFGSLNVDGALAVPPFWVGQGDEFEGVCWAGVAGVVALEHGCMSALLHPRLVCRLYSIVYQGQRKRPEGWRG